jgi:hypothetical protein
LLAQPTLALDLGIHTGDKLRSFFRPLLKTDGAPVATAATSLIIFSTRHFSMMGEGRRVRLWFFVFVTVFFCSPALSPSKQKTEASHNFDL